MTSINSFIINLPVKDLKKIKSKNKREREKINRKQVCINFLLQISLKSLINFEEKQIRNWKPYNFTLWEKR